MHHKIPISIFSSVFSSREPRSHLSGYKTFWYIFTSRLLNWDDRLKALSKSGKGKEAAGREKKLAYLPFVEVMDNLTAQTFLTLPLWLRRIMQELSQRSVLPLKQLTVQKQSKCSLCWKCNYWTLNQWQQLNTANRSLNLHLKQSGISDLQIEKTFWSLRWSFDYSITLNSSTKLFPMNLIFRYKSVKLLFTIYLIQMHSHIFRYVSRFGACSYKQSLDNTKVEFIHFLSAP